MAKTVYVIGAGINMVVRHATRGIRPPLALNFFRQLHAGLGEAELAQLSERNAILYEYVKHYWKLGVHDLSEADFDLEECFTLLEYHERDAIREQDLNDRDRLWKIKGQLTALFAGLLDEISFNQPPGEEGLGPLARRILDEEAAVVTFNYDTLLEQAIVEELSGRRWDPVLAYSTPFDRFEPGEGEPFEEFRSFRFPAQAHRAPFLKLHGSLNWFCVAGGGGEPVEEAPGMFVQRHEKLNRTLVRPVGGRVTTPQTGNTHVLPDGTLLEQLIITPVLNKDVDRKPFAQAWQRAKEEMRGCEHLVVGGYSFPPSDFATRRLFLESFVGGPPDELVVINPDTSVVRRVKNLCHFERPVSVCGGLDEYLA
ncbi:MAG: SIR2 family protein [Actinomycetota bacterium]|nr:SIR2 family protein [Actinomycetota bacterium]